MPSRFSTDYRNLRPYVLEDVRAIVAASGASGGSAATAALTAHRLNDTTVHIGQLDPAQATWALTVSAADLRYVQASRQIIAGDGLTGGGTLAGDVTLNVGAGAGITVAADTVALTTPGTLTVSSTNTATGSHTHAVTSSSNPGAAASLLASASDGALTLTTLTATTKLRSPLLDTATGNLTLQPAGDITIDPVGNDVLPATNYDINLGALTKKYLTLHAAELWVETLVAQNTIATIGGRILVGPTTTLTRDLAAAGTTIYVKHNQMISGDRAYMEADGKVEFFGVTSAATTISATEYSYTVTRNLDGTGANDWYAGDAMFNTGQTGNGFIDLYSVRGVKAASQYGPTIVGNVRLSSTYNDWSERWAVGNLNGLYGYGTNVYGFAAGVPSGTWIAADATNGLRIMRGSTARLQADTSGNLYLNNSAGTNAITLDSSGNSFFSGVMTIGTAGEIRQGTGTLGSDFTGLRIWRDLNVGLIGGYNNNVPQWYANTDGKLYAGGGTVTLSSTGIAIAGKSGSSSVPDAVNRIDFTTGGAAFGYIGAATTVGTRYISIYQTGGGQNGSLLLTSETADSGKIASVDLVANNTASSGQGALYVSSDGTISAVGNTTITGALTVTSTVSLNGRSFSASGNRWDVLPYVDSSGYMEIGAYLDFHASDGSTADYAMRLALGTSNALAVSNSNGGLTIGPQNTTYCHFTTDRNYFYLNKPTAIDGAATSYSGDFILQREGYEKLRLHSNGAQLTGQMIFATVYSSGTGEPAAPSAGAVLYLWDTGTAKELRIRFAGGSGIKIVGT